MNSANQSTEGDPRILQIARQFLEELEAGHKPKIEDYLKRYPNIDESLAEYLEGVEMVHNAGQAVRPPKVSDPIQNVTHFLNEEAKPLGDFQIVRQIGRGGMGVVYEAIQLSLGRRVALKVLPFAAALDNRQLQRFKTEAHAAAQLHHNHIVPVYAVGAERGLHFYAMQLIEGQTLDCLIKELRGESVATAQDSTTEGTVPNAKISTQSLTQPSRTHKQRDHHKSMVRLAIQAAEALAYAHDVGVIHRDIKPANLIVDHKQNIWITDFGLAQVSTNPGITESGDIVGTLRYMSPEQARGQRGIDHRTDIYSLGATLYEMLVLEPVFPGQDRNEILHKIFNSEPTPLRQLDRSIPIELETVVHKSLAKDPHDRYETASDFAADLRRFLEGRPVLARRPSLIDRVKKWARRHPGIIGTTVLILFLGVVGLATTTGMIAREQSKTQQVLDDLKAEQTKTQQALEEAHREKMAAEQRFALARRSADELIKLSEEELGDDPISQGFRKRVLESALAYYQELIEIRRGDPNAQNDLAITRDRVNQILADLTVLQGAGSIFLLNEPFVLDDLKVVEPQRSMIREFVQRFRESGQEMFRDFHRLKEEERRQRFLEQARHAESELSRILSASQQQRMKQLVLQSQGIRALRDPSIANLLKLTPDQREKLRALESEPFAMRMDWGGPPPSGPRKGGFMAEKGGFGEKAGFGEKGGGFGERGGPYGKFGGFGPEGGRLIYEKAMAILTTEQKNKWREMIGEPLIGIYGKGPPPKKKD